MVRNSTLNSLDEVFDIIKRPPKKESVKVLPRWKQRIFTELHGLSGEVYKRKLYEVYADQSARSKQIKKVNWVMKKNWPMIKLHLANGEKALKEMDETNR